MEKELLRTNDRNHKAGEGKLSFKHQLADLYVIREDELGTHEDYIHCRTHLGQHLDVGDEVLGYDMKNMNCNSDAFDGLDGNHPDAILVRKVYAESRRRAQLRKFKLRRVIDYKADDVSIRYSITCLIFLGGRGCAANGRRTRRGSRIPNER